MATPDQSVQEARRLRTILWVVSLATVGLIFDGYDLVVYGAVVKQFLSDPTQIGQINPAIAGQLGSYALFGVLVGALMAGTVGDIIGRRKVMLGSYAWFSIGMGITAMTSDAASFGWMRFITGLGVGALVATTGALVAEYAPKDKKNLCNAIVYSGIPLGSLLAALLAIMVLESIGWRGMFWLGALPFVTLLPLAYFKMPESVAWLASHGRLEEARALSERTGVPLPEAHPAHANAPAVAGSRKGFVGLFADYLGPTVLLGLMSALGLLLVYSLNTWLPVLMGKAGFNAKGSLEFLLILNGGAVIGALVASKVADRFGAKSVVVACFAIGAVSIFLMTMGFPVAGLLAIVAVVGLGTSGTQVLIYGLVSNYYRTNVRGAGVAWCAGFGRLGGVVGPLVVGYMQQAELPIDTTFQILAGIAAVGGVLTLVLPMGRSAAAKPALKLAAANA